MTENNPYICVDKWIHMELESAVPYFSPSSYDTSAHEVLSGKVLNENEVE
ncbi:MAG: hypothetical protein WCP46_03335 [Alphaproteobacteria bacterium]